jgi:SAM-dependent methyltransferase
MGESVPRTDYLGVHLPVYRRIAAGERAGWSDDEEAEGTLAQFAEILSQAGVEPAGSLLELGCGDGCLSVRLAQRGGLRVAGIDIVPLAIELARRRAESAGVRIELKVGSVTALPWPEASFDLVLDGHCLHCISGADRAGFFAEALRVLRPGGHLVLVTMCGDPPLAHREGFDPQARVQIRDGIAGRYFGTPSGILAEAADAGFCLAAQRIWPARHANECDDLVAALRKPG